MSRKHNILWYFQQLSCKWKYLWFLLVIKNTDPFFLIQVFKGSVNWDLAPGEMAGWHIQWVRKGKKRQGKRWEGERGLKDCKDYVLVSFLCNAKELGLYFEIVMHHWSVVSAGIPSSKLHFRELFHTAVWRVPWGKPGSKRQVRRWRHISRQE